MGEDSSVAEYQPLHSPSASGQFRPQVFDPFLIITQIGAIQSIFYASSTALLLIGSRPMGYPLSLRYLLDPETVTLQSTTGRWLVLMYFLNALALAFMLQILVKRSKLCLDFVATCILIHLCLSWIYCSQFPSAVTWWIVQILAAVLATLLGEWLCLRIEIEAIPVNQPIKTDV
ncbi:protein SYS1 homolog [Paramacrobiotus metropolitanus]|uniref:protein SYS1 homolog n=1 Tax=Paramacrobiotus metropolitanus TaxID=2943436 RepID=UPI0024462BFA|nr:protein SYS1 homolog [Paramacrobiotus metropolitanus]